MGWERRTTVPMGLNDPMRISSFISASPNDQLRCLERDGIVRRFVHHQVPPKVEYSLTDCGQALCPTLDALLKWVELKESLAERA